MHQLSTPEELSMPRPPVLLIAASAALLSACGSSVPTTATVTTIDRLCTIIEQRMPEDPEVRRLTKDRPVQSSRKGDCNEVEEWVEVKRTKSKRVEGEAEIHFVYVGPDGKQRQGSLTYTGADDEFYEVKSGDSLPIRVAEDDPTRVYRS
jgi:hypothetical protein